MFDKSISFLKSLSIFISILFLFLVATYVFATRVTLHFLPQYKHEILVFLKESTNQNISFSNISSRWDGFDPVIQITDFSIESDSPIHIKNISLYFSFAQSLLSLQPKFDRVLIEDSEVSVRQTIDGDWEVLNFKTNELNSNLDNSLDQDEKQDYKKLSVFSIFNGSTVNIKNLSTVIYNDKGKLRTLRLPTLNVNYRNNQIFASGKILQKLGEKTLLNFSFKGNGLLPHETMKSVLYVEARSSEFFGELLGVYNWQSISIRDIEGSNRAWINFDGTEVTSIFGELQISEINWNAGEKSLAPIHNLVFSYLLKNSDTNQELIIDNFGFEWAGNQCLPTDFKVKIDEVKTSISSDVLNIHCLNKLALALDILPNKLHKRLAVSEPSGFLRNIALNIPKSSTSKVSDSVSEIQQESVDSNQQDTFIFEAMLDKVTINAYESTPSIGHLNGYIFANNSSGFVSFLGDDFELGFPKLFIDPWLLKHAEGKVSWGISNSDVKVYSQGLRLWQDDDSLIYGDFTLDINDETQEDYLSLAIGMQDILFQDAVNFVPYHAVNKDLYSWLSDALIAGTVSSGIYYGYGSVESISPKNSFTSSILLNSENGVVKFDPAWPDLEELKAEVVIQNGQLNIDSQLASIAQTKLKNLKAYLPEAIKGKVNSLNIKADSNLSNELVDYWLTGSPIAEKTKNIVSQLDIKASADINLSLAIPFHDESSTNSSHEVQYTVEASINDAEVLHKPSKLNFKQLTGSITVDSKKGINSSEIKTRLLNEPATLSIKTSFHSNTSKKLSKTPLAKGAAITKLEPLTQITKLSLKGKTSLLSIFNYFEVEKVPALTGSLDYLADLTLSSEENKYPLLKIHSDLYGVSCMCPAPFAKSSQEMADFNLSLLLKPDQSYIDASVKSKQLPFIKSELLLTDDKFSFGEILIGGATVKNTNVKGLNIAANIKLANLESWLDFINGLTQKDSQKITKNPEDPALKQIQVFIEDLDGYGYLFQKSNLVLKPTGSSWLIDIDGKNAKGNIMLPDSNAPINLEFDHLNLVSLDKILGKTKEKNATSSSTIDPKSIPQLTFKTNSLMFDSRKMGSWKLEVLPDKKGSLFRNIKGHLNGTNIAGQLNWRYDQGIQSTIATFDVVGEDITPVFSAFDIPVLMSSSKYNSEFALHWPDSPSEFSLNSISGKLKLSLEDGFLKTEDQKTGVLRLFGILNADSIKRRLKLDFTDLYKSGVGYDTFEMKASIDHGLLTLTEPLLIDGPSGKYVLNGRSNLATKALDIDMLVELPFSQNVPLAALVLGAPQIGGLVWVADKLLGEPLSALTTSRYDITGPWDQPTVNLKQAINASKKDRSKERAGSRDVGK